MIDAKRTQGALAAYGVTGKVSLITGAASGMGRATAKLFADTGARVVILDCDEAGAEETAVAIRDVGGEAMVVLCDLADEEQVLGAFGKVEESLGPVEILVNCAAFRGKAEFMEVTPQQWDDMFAITTRGTFYTMRAAIRQMIHAGNGGTIVNISSVCAQHCSIFANAHYDAAKAGVEALTRAAAVEFADHKIRVNCIAPGGVKTEGLSGIQSSIDFRGPATQAGRMLWGYAEPIELSRAIMFLASPASSYITGHVLAVDGGFLAG
jgi:NAD(P)-dependent dehydrogenase (short-subunit alcohol dehydrogenase family)